MRIVRVEHDGVPHVGVIVGDDIRLPRLDRINAIDTSRLLADPAALKILRAAATAAPQDVRSVALGDTKLMAPVARPGKIVAIGLNYRDHAAEIGMPIPEAPLLFAKFPSSIIGPGAPIVIDGALTDAVDIEAELAVVIGRPARRVAADTAIDHVAGYTCLNDVSARDVQFSDGQWVRGKSFDTFCPMGPWLVTPDELPDPGNQRISSTISGEVLQDGSTADLVFGVQELVSYVSMMCTLQPGDVIATGTPAGVGWSRAPQRLLRPGDVVTVTIDGIGSLTNPVEVA